MRILVPLLILSSVKTISVSASAVSAPVLACPTPTKKDGQGNPAIQLFDYVKDSAIRLTTGAKDMWSNHGRCKEIRAKQHDYREKLKKQWELQEKNLSPKGMKARLAAVNGGITYDEFIFLANGKEDRSKLMNLVFLMWGAPRVFPYALMFYPNILPSPFSPLPDASGPETKLEKISRQRAHEVIKALVDLEEKARSVPYLDKLNIFGKKAQERRMIATDNLGRSLSLIMTAPGATGGIGAGMLLETMNDLLYKTGEAFTRGEKRLVGVPSPIILGLMSSISGPGILNGIMPNFMRRGNVVAHAQKISEADSFLVGENVDLESLSTVRLLEACNDRLIGGVGRSEEELRKDLSDWLDLAVVQPATRTAVTGEEFNGNLARAALMGYYSLEAVRDQRCTSYLTRSLFQGQLLEEESKQR